MCCHCCALAGIPWDDPGQAVAAVWGSLLSGLSRRALLLTHRLLCRAASGAAPSLRAASPGLFLSECRGCGIAVIFCTESLRGRVWHWSEPCQAPVRRVVCSAACFPVCSGPSPSCCASRRWGLLRESRGPHILTGVPGALTGPWAVRVCGSRARAPDPACRVRSLASAGEACAGQRGRRGFPAPSLSPSFPRYGVRGGRQPSASSVLS